MSNTVTISRKRYEELLRKEARLQEAEVRAESAEVRAEAEFQEGMAEQQRHTHFWARAWFNTLFWLQGAWEQVHHLGAKVTHTEKLMANPKLKPEQRLYLYAAAPLTVAPKHRDREGRALTHRTEIMQRAGLSESTCYRAAKELEAAGIIDAKSPYNPVKGKKDRFEKIAPQFATEPETLDSQAPKNGGYHPSCNSCESPQTKVDRKTVQTVTCLDCGNISTTILPTRTTIYLPSKQDHANPGKAHNVRMKQWINAGLKASEGSSA